ncbi:hypothetical protein [Catenulispora sp. GP43]|uniref:aromatic-ring hydroxylase C-terminal domain-containing protein n=1 Tax=Catenulispora sp. GP43 TaxID=3156263 RepID=UPI003513FE6C
MAGVLRGWAGPGAAPSRRGRREPVELPWSEQYFAQLGLVLGVAYDQDEYEPSDPGTDYVPTAKPGHRMPHFWLAPGRSTLDAFGEWFTVLTPDPAGWERQLTGPWPLRIESLPAEHAADSGLHPDGALLVRPDGHIGARWQDRPSGDSALYDALVAITGYR